MITTTGKNFKKIHEVRVTCPDDLTWNYRMKHFFLLATVAMIAVKPSIKVKMHQKIFFYFYHYLAYVYWVNVIYLTCLVFLKSPWWLVWIFCARSLLTIKKYYANRTWENILWPMKNFEKYFMAHQYMSKLFHDSHKNPPPTQTLPLLHT